MIDYLAFNFIEQDRFILSGVGKEPVQMAGRRRRFQYHPLIGGLA